VPLICAYIERLNDTGELVRWTVGARGLKSANAKLGTADWNLPTGRVAQVSRSRLGRTDSKGVITDPEDEAIGLATDKRGRDAREDGRRRRDCSCSIRLADIRDTTWSRARIVVQYSMSRRDRRRVIS